MAFIRVCRLCSHTWCVQQIWWTMRCMKVCPARVECKQPARRIQRPAAARRRRIRAGLARPGGGPAVTGGRTRAGCGAARISTASVGLVNILLGAPASKGATPPNSHVRLQFSRQEARNSKRAGVEIRKVSTPWRVVQALAGTGNFIWHPGIQLYAMFSSAVCTCGHLLRMSWLRFWSAAGVALCS